MIQSITAVDASESLHVLGAFFLASFFYFSELGKGFGGRVVNGSGSGQPI